MKSLFFWLILFRSKCFSQSDTSFYSVVNLGKVTGQNKVWKTSSNEYHYNFYFNDRGRGAELSSTVNTNTNGKIEKVITEGLDYYKVPFTSSFQKVNDSLVSYYRQNKTAELDTGQSFVFYGAPAGIEILIKELLNSPKHTLLTVGGDTVFLKETAPYQFKVNGKNLPLLLIDFRYGINGSPNYTWLDENHNFFGDIGGWSATIKRNYEKLVDTLYALQEINSLSFYKNINKQLTDSLPSKLAISNVILFDAPNGKSNTNQTVLVENGVVKAVGNTSEIKVPKGYLVINGTGKTLLPGLWDTHTHYQKDQGVYFLSGGITHVRDMGNMPYVKQLQQDNRKHNLIGPDISYLSGFIDKDDEFHGPVGKLVTSKIEAIKAVDDFSKDGYNQIKIYSSIDTAWVQAMCAEAHKKNMRVAGHIPVHMTAGKAVENGFDEITHMNMVMLNFFPDTIDTRNNRLKPVGRSANTIDLKSKTVIDFIQLLKKNKTVVEPTINIYADMFNTAPGDTNVYYKTVAGWIKNRSIIKNSFIDDTIALPAYKASYTRMLEMLKLLYDNKITLLAGTDDIPPFALQLEMELFVKAGIPANEVLKIATYTPAATFNLQSTIGSIQKNRIADFILVDGNPMEKISDIRKVFMVITNHRLYYPKKLYKYSGLEYYY